MHKRTPTLICLLLCLLVTAAAASASSPAAPRDPPDAGPAVPSPFMYPRNVSGRAVLYSQTGTYSAAIVATNAIGDDVFDSYAADDFTVSHSAGWTVSAFNFAVTFQDGAPDPGTTYNVNVFADAGGVPNDAVPPRCAGVDLSGTLDATHTALSVALPTACLLPAGLYWVVLQANLNASVSENKMYWSSWRSATPPGAPAHWKNPSDAFFTGCLTWRPTTRCGYTGNTQGFEVVGAIGGGGACTVDGICLDVTLGTDLSPGACGDARTLAVWTGDPVNYCYVLTNNSGMPLRHHSLSDNIDGTILDLQVEPVADGASLQYNRILTPAASQTRTAVWSAYAVPPGYTHAYAYSGPIADRLLCTGFEAPPCDPGEGGFIDITITGIGGPIADDGAVARTLPFSFTFYGTTSNALCIGNNGYILFGTTACPTGGYSQNTPLQDASFPAPAILPYWDDFAATGGGTARGIVLHATTGTAPNRKYIVEWFNVAPASDTTGSDDGVTFEVIFDEATQTVRFEYQDVAMTAQGAPVGEGRSATIGLKKNADLFNEFSFGQAVLADQSRIEWPAVAAQSFTAATTTVLDVGLPVIAVAPAALSASVAPGGSLTLPLAVNNTGTRELTWRIDPAPSNAHLRAYAEAIGASATPADVASRIGSVDRQRPSTPHKPLESSPAPLGATAAPSFAITNYSREYLALDAATPGTATVIAPAPEGPLYKTATFVNDVFTKQYVAAVTPGYGTAIIDTATGTATPLGGPPTVPGDQWFGIKWDEISDTLYGAGCGVLSTEGPYSCHLYKIDPRTGAVTEGPLVTGAGDPTYGLILIDIAIDPSGLMYGINYINGDLVAIDKLTGAAQVVGSTGVLPQYVQSIDFDQATGSLYWASYDGSIGNMYRVDTTTAALTLVGPLVNNEEIYAFSIATSGGACLDPADVPWLSTDRTSGLTLPGTGSMMNVTFNALGLASGTHTAMLCIFSNDPANRRMTVPVRLVVGDGSP